MDNGELRRRRVFSGDTNRDNRTHFQRDRDRILYTPAFRRLTGVTQVVHSTKERGYHNRLTHSLKVAQVGRRLAERLKNETDEESIEAAGGLSPDVVESACLAHDLGHPPFGHAAEKAIQNYFDQQNDLNFSGFEGNPQSFRIVNSVAIHKTSYTGHEDHVALDLTLATLNAMLKYPWERRPTGKRSKKWGFYETEREVFEQARELRTPGSSDSAMSLEAKIMDWADDLTYAIHDLVDFYQAGLIPLGDLVRSSTEREELVDSFEQETDVDDTWDATAFLESSVNKIGEVAASQADNTLVSSFDGSSHHRATLGFLASELVERYLGVNDVRVEIDPGIDGGLDISENLKNEVRLLKYLTEYYVFNDPALVAQQHGHRKVVEELVEILYQATEENSEYMKLVPSPHDERVNAIHNGEYSFEEMSDNTLRARVVSDIIASMSEEQALDLHSRVAGQSPGLITDKIVTN